MRFGICAPYREVATLETYPFDYLEENVQRFLIPKRPQSVWCVISPRRWQKRTPQHVIFMPTKCNHFSPGGFIYCTHGSLIFSGIKWIALPLCG
jgi:hypothetical protein